MERPDFIRHWRELESPDDSGYAGDDERMSFGAPLGRALGLTKIAFTTNVCCRGGVPVTRTQKVQKMSLSTCWKARRMPGSTATCTG